VLFIIKSRRGYQTIIKRNKNGGETLFNVDVKKLKLGFLNSFNVLYQNYVPLMTIW